MRTVMYPLRASALLTPTENSVSGRYHAELSRQAAVHAVFMDITRTLGVSFVPDLFVGIELNGVAKAYPFAEIKKIGSPISDQLGRQAITIHFNPQTRSASVTDADGKPLPSVMAYWFAWYTFHPKTKIFTAP